MLNMKPWAKIIQLPLGVRGKCFIISERKEENHFTVKGDAPFQRESACFGYLPLDYFVFLSHHHSPYQTNL